MKKITYLLFAIIVSISFFINCNDSKETVVSKKKEHVKVKTEKKAPFKEKTVKMDFNKEPVKFMGEIFKSYHDWKLEKGLKLSEEAILIIDKIYKDDPDQIIKDPNLKLNKAFQIKSTLHTLKGMLHFRTSLHSKNNPVRTENQAIMDKLKKGKKITNEDFEDLSKKIESNSSSKKTGSLELAENEFINAIKSDKNNPSSHFHLAEILKNSDDKEIKLKAEEHYYESARLSIKESDYKSIDKILNALKGLNPKSAYIEKIEKMNKGIKNGIH